MANFQQGFLTSLVQGEFEETNDRGHFPGIYAQDSWKLNRRLTFDYGLRWEMFAPWHNKVGVQTAFSPTEFAANRARPNSQSPRHPGTPACLPAWCSPVTRASRPTAWATIQAVHAACRLCL
jgi:hypothetical protein